MIECKGLNYFYKTWLYIIFIVRRYCKEKGCQAFKLLIDSSKLLVFCKSMESFGLYMVHFIVTWFSCTNGFITSFVKLCKLYNYSTWKDCRPSTYYVLNLFSQFQVLLNCTPFTHIHFQVHVTTEIIILHLDSYLCLPMKENLLTSLKKRW